MAIGFMQISTRRCFEQGGLKGCKTPKTKPKTKKNKK